MRLSLPERKIEPNEGFANDLFGFGPFGERFANIVREIDQPFVIALDGAWGSGKSTFMKQWAGLLRDQGAAVIEFDAFGNDHHDDAFLALSAEIYRLAADTLGASRSITQNYLKRAKATANVLLPIGARIATRAATAGLVSLDDIKESGEAANAVLDALGKEGEKWAEKVVSEHLRGAAKERAALQAFRDTLASLAKELARGQAAHVQVDSDTETSTESSADNNHPLVVIIDELDRCRPPFALSLIERIKHLFLVEDVCFVLVTHLPQLETAVQGAYGGTFNAREYLEKFYHLRVVLPKNCRGSGTNSSVYIRYLWRELDLMIQNGEQNRLTMDLVNELAQIHELSLRSIERLVSLLVLVSVSVGKNYLFIAPLVVGLCLMRLRAPQLYERVILGKAKYKEVAGFLFNATGSTAEQADLSGWALNWWRYATGENIDEEFQRHVQHSYFQYHVDQERLLPVLGEYIDSFEVRV